MRRKTFTVAGSAGGPTYSPVYPVDTYENPCNIGIGVTVSGAETIADVQHTFADPWSQNLNVVSAVPWDTTALVSATQAGAANGTWSTNYAFPPTGIRLRVRALTSAGAGNAATIVIQQAGKE